LVCEGETNMVEIMSPPVERLAEPLPPSVSEAMYVGMLTIREAEERLADLVVAGEVKCPCHLYSGEEAIAVPEGVPTHPVGHIRERERHETQPHQRPARGAAALRPLSGCRYRVLTVSRRARR
jgi:hypothetical protein